VDERSREKKGSVEREKGGKRGRERERE